ncbi:DeoR family transcriptional regulator [Angustibacter sp. Root456]|uniref:DeoR family transcriptional regulator n=1 Tax=Angustibacter sp. Root456 TaxID=1736539 RepID=UPI0006F49B94|nr:DeoR family transcriptional regulator [Angustibacter sp. Root456]KQX69756.1 hypothetical protein ASD06_01620 [Angustibacter sp. Root456]
MTVPLPQLRLTRLRRHVRSTGGVTVAEVVEMFGVSPMTAHRDLAALSRTTPDVQRVQGGAVRTSSSPWERPEG